MTAVDRRGPLSNNRLAGEAGIRQEEPVGPGSEEVEAEEAAPAAAGAATEVEPTTGGVGTDTHAGFTKAEDGPGEPPLWKKLKKN